MANPVEYPGILNAIRIRLSGSTTWLFYRAQDTKYRIHTDQGDVTSGEDAAKRRVMTVFDWELTLTKASYDPNNDPFTLPLALALGDYIDVQIYPGGLSGVVPFTLYQGQIDDFDYSSNANSLSPLSFHATCSGGVQPLYSDGGL